MKTGFKNVLKDDSDFQAPKSAFQTNFKMPEYDKRTSCYVKAGEDYGVGHRQPVGTEKHSGKSVIPFGRVATQNLYEE